MKITTKTTSKGQITIPKVIRTKIGLEEGMRVNIYATEGGFVGKLHRKSRILDLIGDLKYLDKGESLREIRQKAQEAAAKDRVRRFLNNENSSY